MNPIDIISPLKAPPKAKKGPQRITTFGGKAFQRSAAFTKKGAINA